MFTNLLQILREILIKVIILSASLTCFTSGVLFSWTSPSIPILISEYNFTMEECSYLTVIAPFSSMVCGFVYSKLVDKIGRKYSLLTTVIPHTLSLILIAVANDMYVFYISRLITGVADACMFSTVPTYIGEISTPKVRGTWGNTLMLSFLLGQVAMNTSGGFLSIKTNALLYLPIPLLFLCFSYFIPESPYFLIMKERDEDAKKTLQFLRHTKNVDEELAKLKSDVARQMSESGTWKDLFVIRSNREAFFIGAFLRTAQQLSGILCFMSYSKYIFQQAGGSISSTESSIIFSSACLLSNFCSSMILDKIGRRPAMVTSLFGCTIFLFAEAAYFYLSSDHTNIDASSISWIPLTGMLFYVITYSIGLGVVPTLALTELFSASIKGKGVCVLNILFSLLVSAATKIFQVLESNFGMYSALLFFSACSLCNGIAAIYIVLETKGKTLEEIQQFLKSKKLRKI